MVKLYESVVYLVHGTEIVTDPVTTTDELIPSGETSSHRSNPERLSEFALSRRDPEYAGRGKAVRQMERDRRAGTPDHCRRLSDQLLSKPLSSIRITRSEQQQKWFHIRLKRLFPATETVVFFSSDLNCIKSWLL